MAAITWTDVTNHAAELSTVDSNAQTDILALVNTALDVDIFDDGEDDPRLKLCRIYMAAHYGSTLQTSAGGGAGVVTGRSQGDMSISYGFLPASSSTDSEFGSTGYGRMYLSLIRGTVARGGMLL